MCTFIFRLWRGRRFSQLLLLLVLSLVSCSTTNGNGAPPSSTIDKPVNGFGIVANHVHSLLALSPQVLLLATHYGLFRSQDDGKNWQEVAGGKGQLMDGLMTYSLSSDSRKSRHLYVLAQPAVAHYTGTPGLYRSDDGGNTWKLLQSAASLNTSTIFLVEADKQNAEQVYLYLSNEGAQGLRVSYDGGLHFRNPGTLPFDSIIGLLALPGASGHLLAYSSGGIAFSSDGGTHWQKAGGIEGGIYSVATGGEHGPIYASGDAGFYLSADGGATFKLVYTQYAFLQLATAEEEPQTVYGKIGVAYCRSNDGGRSWQTLPSIKGNLGILAVDPTRASTVYLSLSYPAAIYDLTSESPDWRSLTPSA